MRPEAYLFAQVCAHVDGFGNRDKYLTSGLLKLGYRCHELRGAFSRFYFRHSELIVKYIQYLFKDSSAAGMSEPDSVFFCDLVYKFKRVVGESNFDDWFRWIIKRYKRVGYSMDIM